MTTRRESVVVSLLGVLSDVYAGKISPLSVVAHYAPKQEQVLQLLACLQKGYPLGSFLLGQLAPGEDFHAQTLNRLGPVLRSDDATHPNVVLSGYGRLAMLAWAFADAAEGLYLSQEEVPIWGKHRIYYSMEDDAFSFQPVTASLNTRYLPARSIFDVKNSNMVMRNLWRSPEWQEFPEDVKEGWARNLERTQEALRTQTVQVVTLQGLTAHELEEAYWQVKELNLSA